MMTTCPNEEQLRAFAVGDISGPALESVAQHVANCTTCDASLEELDEYTDEFVDDLGVVNSVDSTDEISVPHNVTASAKGAVESSGVTSSNFTTDPGKRYAKRLAEGPCRIGKFELQAELGDGSFGYVFRARDVELDRTVAVKIQRAGSFADDEEVNRFLREARSAAQLQHPGIVSLYDSGKTEDDVCFLVTEYVDGNTLETHLQKKHFEPRAAAEFVAELAATLQYAHDHGVVHRDMKPSNVILDEKGHPHITDFGLAKRLSADRSMTSDGRVMGTPAYMSPEQARGDSHNVDARSDVYSLGVMLYELLTGERPFQGNRRLLMLQTIEDDPQPPRQRDDQIPKDLETICLKTLAKSPPRRYQTADELADDLNRFLADEPILARPIGYTERLWRWCHRNPLAASLLLAVTLGSTIGFWHLSYLSTYFVQETALDSARMEADMLERIHEYYSKDIFKRTDWKQHGIEVTHEYMKGRNRVPLPASFLIDAGKWISEGKTGMEVKLYSEYPWRKDVEQQDRFQMDAIKQLQAKINNGEAELSYHRFTEKDGRSVVRYARAQIMKKNCIDCHNESPLSPKRNWQKGDLAGVLEITRPLDEDIERTRAGLGGAFILMGGTGVLLLGLSFGMVVASRVRSRRTVNG